jgi:hypothetical protein
VKTGLSPRKDHTIRVIVRGDRNTSSTGTVIRHMAFEYSDECYRASSDFSGINGKNRWSYRVSDGKASHNLAFFDFVRTIHKNEKTGMVEPHRVFANWWGDSLRARIGNDYQVSGDDEAARTWAAPHGGHIRIDGDIHLDNDSTGTARALIRIGNRTVWDAGLIGSHKVHAHKLSLTVRTGEEIDFVVVPAPGARHVKVIWDPVVRYY